MKIKPRTKKAIVLSVMVVLLVATGVLNWALNDKLLSKDEPASADTVTETFFATYRSDRDSTRESEYLYLDAIITSADSSAESKALAEEQKLALVMRMEQELTLETLIKAKGFEECVAVISGDKANIVVKSEGLQPNQLSQILEIVYLQADIVPANVTISEK